MRCPTRCNLASIGAGPEGLRAGIRPESNVEWLPVAYGSSKASPKLHPPKTTNLQHDYALNKVSRALFRTPLTGIFLASSGVSVPRCLILPSSTSPLVQHAFSPQLRFVLIQPGYISIKRCGIHCGTREVQLLWQLSHWQCRCGEPCDPGPSKPSTRRIYDICSNASGYAWTTATNLNASFDSQLSSICS